MKKAALFLFLVIFLTGCQNHTTADKYATANNVYTMNLVLDVENDGLDVEGELYYKNDVYDLEELYITIYPNAYNLRATGDNAVFQYFRIDGTDVSYEITGEDRTALHVTLEEPLPKGQRISITYRYEFRYWDLDRMADYGDYYLTMFFYPCVAMLDATGWNVEPYSFMGETYYNEIGDYYVSIDVPADYEIACGGKSVHEQRVSGRKIIEYELLDARDFSFCASSLYHVYSRTLLGIDFQIYSIRDLTAKEKEDSFGYLENTVSTMEADVGDYPYDHFTLEYGNFYGMESTGVVYCSAEIQEGTVVHEVIHQWFYSMVGNDQADESFLDEALTTYAASLYYYDLYGLEGYDDYLDYRTSLKPALAEKYTANQGVSLLRQVDEYGEYYGFLIYYHGPALFRYYVDEFLDGDIGRMASILHAYFVDFAGKNATLEAFLDLLERESGVPETKEWFYLQLNELQDFANRPA